jgi:hypothetical protein
MPYLNKRNRFVQAAKTFAESCNPVKYTFTKSDLAGLFTTTTATV